MTPDKTNTQPEAAKLNAMLDDFQSLSIKFGIIASRGDDEEGDQEKVEAAKAALLAEFTRLSAMRTDAAADAQWLVDRCNQTNPASPVHLGAADIVRMIRSQALASIAESKRAAPSPQGLADKVRLFIEWWDDDSTLPTGTGSDLVEAMRAIIKAAPSEAPGTATPAAKPSNPIQKGIPGGEA